jgi:predicted transcriptional regulator
MQPISRMPATQVLEQIERNRIAQQRAEAALAKLIDQAVGLGIGWPEIATRLGVTRQAARQHYQRRHRGSVSVQERRS